MKRVLAGLSLGALLLRPAFGATPGLKIRPPDEIEFSAIVHARTFINGWTMPGYHAIVWKSGSAAADALLVAEVSDASVLDAIESLGSRGADNVPLEAWTKRKDRRNRASEVAMAGPRIEVLLRLPKHPALTPLSEVLTDPGGRGLDLRLGGNRANISKWKSGCIVCLYSCPGSKIGNAHATLRDYIDKKVRFEIRPGLLPPDGARVSVVLRLSAPRNGSG